MALDPAVLFFVFGVAAGLVRSNLEIPAAISRFLSLYLLMAIGLKGGFALAETGLTREVFVTLGSAVALAFAVPVLAWGLLRRWLGPFDAAAVAATYGSVSAVTFITAMQYLDERSVAYGAHMSAAMALMESPAIFLAVLLASRYRLREFPSASSTPSTARSPVSLSAVMHEALTDGAQLLLLGALVVGLVTGQEGQAVMKPFASDLFKGMLAFFLLDMGLQTARNLPSLRECSAWALAYAFLAPPVHALMALLLCSWLSISVGNATLLMVLAASASYIAVPAVIRQAIPEARPALYFGMSLGLTFPLNILVGIPLYAKLAAWALA